ncbi:MAG TPA: Uma2 family endonuclease, partial [Planctomycetaceae bacterium]|nr:Uma2 family endonuclease [Planctomycetaceae bacterium]
KSEYYRGEIFAMAGASEVHNIIVGNLIRHLGNALEGRPCQVYPSDMRVKCPTGLLTYPDVSIVCGERKFDDEQRDTLLNPRVLFEVLSPSREAYDRGKKFRHYRTLPSLREYVLIAQDQVCVEKFLLPNDGGPWTWTAQTEGENLLTLGSCEARVRIADLYAGVEFPPPTIADVSPFTVYPDGAPPR